MLMHSSQRGIRGKFYVSLLFLLFAGTGTIMPTPIRLAHQNKSMPFVISFPRDYASRVQPNPALPGSLVYTFWAQDPYQGLVYGASLATHPDTFGLIDTTIARLMTTEALSAQIDVSDELLGDYSRRYEFPMPQLDDYTHRTARVIRDTEPPLFGKYVTLMRDRVLISIWVSGLWSTANRAVAQSVFESIVVD